MSLTFFETKQLMQRGFKQLRNPFFEAMTEKNAYSMKNKVNPISVAFYVAPYVNAIVRSGTQEEKQVVFRSMLNHEAYKKIPSTKRGHKLGEVETVLAQALRVCTNVKNRQTRAQDAGLALLEKLIEERNLLDHKVLLFLLEPGQIDRNIAGLIANKFMAKYQRPCCILTKVTEEIPCVDQNKNDENVSNETYIVTSYQGSARGYDKSGITNFKDICSDTKCIRFAEGHQGAFGLGIDEEKIEDFISATDEALKDMSSEPIYWVDFIYNGANVDADGILEIAEYEDLWGKDMDEPLVAISDVRITKDMVILMSPDKSPTLKINLPNGVSLVKFGSSQEEYEKFLSDGWIKADFIGRCNANSWGGKKYPQIYIEDYSFIDSCQYFF
jgi:single-stranded-DNA-specific exonuclease